MMDFVIPLDKDELLRDVAGQYTVENVVSIKHLSQALDGVKKDMAQKGARYILDNFDVFFSFLVHGNKVDIPTAMRAFIRLEKGMELLAQKLDDIDDFTKVDLEEKNKYKNIIKMNAYLISNLLININSQVYRTDDNNIYNIGKRKKAQKKTDSEEEWESERKKMLLLIYRCIQFPLHNFWQPPIVEDAFISTITQACYKVLETTTEHAKESNKTLNPTSETIFEILGTFVKRYNYGLTCVIHIIQLVKQYENLSVPMALGMIYMTMKCDCKGLIEKIMQEIGTSEIEDTTAKNIAMFLDVFKNPECCPLLIPVLDELTEHLANDNYVIRNSVLDIVGNIVSTSLSGDNLDDEQKDMRDTCLDLLFDHILDVNAHTRSKVLQVWQTLSCGGAVPLKRQAQLTQCTALRLEDKGVVVRKQALVLLRCLLEANPYAAKMKKEEIEAKLNTAKEDLAKMQAAVVAESGPGADVRFDLWENHAPVIHRTIKDLLADEENENYDDNVEINDDQFEEIRQLMLNSKIKKAVALTIKISKQVYNTQGMEDISTDQYEKALLALLYKIFIDSENVQKRDLKKDLNIDDRNAKKINLAKKVVDYWKGSYVFVEELENAVTMAEKLIMSTVISDAIEACTFLATAYKFKVNRAENGFRKALFQVFYRDPSVGKNVAAVYKEVYLSNEEELDSRQKALTNASKLLNLLDGLEGVQVKALSQLLALWRENKDLDNEIIKVLWETFAMKISNCTEKNSRGALLLLGMIAQAEPTVVHENLDALIKVGFGPRSDVNLLLARDTCRALLKIRSTSTDVNAMPLRFENDHEIFTHLTRLLVDNYTVLEEKGYVSFAVEAINVIYHLADQPEEIVKELLLSIAKPNDDEATVPEIVLRNYMIIIGHVAIRQMIHLDTAVYKEMKRRNAVRDGKDKRVMNKSVRDSRRDSTVSNVSTKSASHSIRNKETSEPNVGEEVTEESLEGASADDADAEYIHNFLENELLRETGLLYQLVPSILEVCQNPDKYNSEDVQAAAVLALTKFMTISSKFCKQQLQLLITILQKSPHAGIRSNVIVGLADLMSIFPNQVEPWASHIYGRLQDPDDTVRTTCVQMLSNLIMREMIRVKGQVAELAMCIMDSNENIRQHTKQFFKDLANKGNALFNIMPDIISCLTNPEKNIEIKKFEEVMKFIFSLLKGERQNDSIIDKICARLRLATTDNQLQNLAYCLSLLTFNMKNIMYMIEFLPQMKDIIHHKTIYGVMIGIVEQGKKKVETKTVATELEEKIEQLFDSPESAEALADKIAMPPPRVPARRGRKAKKTANSSDDSDSDDSDSHKKRGQRIKAKKTASQKSQNSDSDSDDEKEVKQRRSHRQNAGRRRKPESDSDSDDEQPRRSQKIGRRIQSSQGVDRKKKLDEAAKKTGTSPAAKKNKNSQPESSSNSKLRRSKRL